MSSSNSKSVVIIGAGPGGLASAILLANRGFRVRVIERMPVVGGRTSSLQAGPYTFDLGPTFFLYPQVLEKILNEVGRDLHRELDLRRLDPQYRILFGEGGQIDATPDPERMRREIARLAPDDAHGFERFMSENRRKLATFAPVLESPFSGWSDLLNPRLFDALPQLNPHQSVDSYLRKFFKDPRVRLSFCFQSKYLGMSPFRCPSLFSILSFLEYEHGVFHPIGGCAAISQALARIAREMGVEIHLGEPVQSIRFEGKQAKGVTTPAGTYPCDALVINADFARAMTSLVPDSLRRNWSDRKIATKKFSCSTFMIYLGIEGKYELPHHTIFISENYEENLAEIDRHHVLSKRPSFYVQNASVTDPTLAPEGGSTLYILAPVTHDTGSIDWKTEAGPFRDMLLKRLALAGFRGVEDRIRFERVITPADWDSDYNIHRGATFNLAHSLDQMLHLRPRNRFEDLEGVYLVGGGTHPGSGLPVIFESARITADLMSSDFGATIPATAPLETVAA
jgi:phytoene desaturase